MPEQSTAVVFPAAAMIVFIVPGPARLHVATRSVALPHA